MFQAERDSPNGRIARATIYTETVSLQALRLVTKPLPASSNREGASFFGLSRFYPKAA